MLGHVCVGVLVELLFNRPPLFWDSNVAPSVQRVEHPADEVALETGIFGATNGGDDLVEGETERQALRQNLAHEWNPRFGQQGR